MRPRRESAGMCMRWRCWCWGLVLWTLLAGCEGKPALIRLARRPGHGAEQQRRLGADEARLYGDTNELMVYHADIMVGTPGQLLSVIVDTGSSWTAFPCTACENCGTHMDPPFRPKASSTFSWVGCDEDGCSSCTNGNCSYSAHYVEGSSIEGVYFTDVLHLGAIGRANEKSPVRMGCHTVETGLFKTQVPSGIMGMRDGRWNVMSQLVEGHLEKNMFALCLAERGGSLSLGEVNSTWMPTTEPWQWVPYSKAHYLTIDSVSMGGSSLFSESLGSFLLDSGTTYTYFTQSQAATLEDQIRSFCLAGGCGAAEMLTGACWKAKEEDLDEFPDLRFSLGGATYTWTARGYLDRRPDDRWCYAFFGMPPLTLGASFMRNHAVAFDQDGKRIGFAAANCPEFTSRDDAGPPELASAKRGTDSFLQQLSAGRRASSLTLLLLCLASYRMTI